ncbi:hypothetical protein LY90DRAFT_517451 [Neocallimastix californiae]|uniref:EGF-like domain-containing protein n=1 Tax=Neocallimastix californiae TaxID=1754190 RepID=A0A1Y2A7I0_9FUNG|nr:hypothetical protein LY90DRAFT_517451 [Neocallimastix californiae]|eukprot:ORY18280.1 hypothetical protein LY90DRAFT_517451 [Neocallimastix californiae]
MINIFNKPASFHNCLFDNILCNGDVDYSSLITFTSSLNNNYFNMNEVTINKCMSNGDFIIIQGSKSNIKFENMNINNTISYGSLINNLSFNSEIIISNAYVINNKNTNKLKCGLITNNGNTNLIIDNSKFERNENKNNGGVICFMNIDDSRIKISSSSFINNYALNGGVMYLYDRKLNDIKKNNDFILEIYDSSFIKNNANYFGGVFNIEANSLKILNMKNLNFTKNSAYAGGILYSNTINFNNFQKDIISMNNIAESHGNEYASSPYMVNLNTTNSNEISVKSGDKYPLTFVLKDKFNQTVTDVSRYYSNMILTIYDDNDKNIENIKITGNICSFSKGICELKDFKIYSETAMTIDFKFSIQNENKILFGNNKLKMIINECNEEQIKMYYNKYYYCEYPKCDLTTCPNENANCEKGDLENINTIKSNHCICKGGWGGNNCSEKIYANISNYI